MLALVLLVGALAPLARAADGSIGTPISDFGVDTNGNGYYDELMFTVPINVTTPGQFLLTVYIYDSTHMIYIAGNQASVYLVNSTTLAVGLNGVTIRQAGIDGPYDAYIVLYDMDQGYNFLDSVWRTTGNYLAREFEPVPIAFAPPHWEEALDLNANGFYDLFELHVNLTVSTEADYILTGYIHSPDYLYWDSASTESHLTSGSVDMSLNYSGYGVRAAGVDGPYLMELYLYDLNYNLLASDTYTTAPYSAASFESPPGVLSPPYSDYGIDKDGDGLFDEIGVNISVSVSSAASFTLGVDLWNSNGSVFIRGRQVVAELSSGLNVVEVDFPTEPMVSMGIDGPYMIQVTLYVTDENVGRTVNIGQDTAFTSPYSVSQFDPIGAKFGPVITDAAVDRDTPSDGLYDVLAVTLTVQVSEAGIYFVDGYLTDSYSNYLGYDEIYVPAGVGNHTITMNFPGPDIRTYGNSGNFEVELGLYQLTFPGVAVLDTAWHLTDVYDVNEFVYAAPAILDGYVRDAATGDPVPYTGIEAFNYRWLKEIFSVTDGTGYYSMPVEEGSWVVTPEPYEVVDQAIGLVNVTAPYTTLDFDLPAIVPQTNWINLTFGDWGSVVRDRAWIFSYQASTARQYYDWWYGNRDGYLTNEEYNGSLIYPYGLPAPYPSLSSDLFQVDGSAFGLVPGSDSYAAGEVEGSIFDPRPMTGLQTAAFTNANGSGPSGTHTIAVNVSYDVSFNDRIYDVALPAGFTALAVSAPPEFSVSGLGTGTVTINPPLPEGGDSNLTAYAWVTIDVVAADATPPAIESMGVSPSPAELGQTATFTADVTDDALVQAVTLEIWDPDGISLGNVTLSGSGGTYTYTFVPEALGTYTYTVLATDLLQGTVASGSFEVVDTTAPAFGSVAATPNPTELGADTTIAAAVSDANEITAVSAEVHGPSGDLLANYSMTYDSVAGHWAVSQTFTDLGAYAFTIWATDASGNVASTTGTFDVVDTTPPSLSEVSAAPDPVEFQNPVTFSFSASDLGGVASASVEVWDPSDAVVGTYTMTYNDATGHWEATQAFSGLGTFTYTVTALDASGNSQTASGSFTVHDTTPPDVTAVAAAPGTAEYGTSVEISADVTDLVAVDTVTVEVRDPQDTLVGNFTMVAGSGNTFAYSLTPDALGTFTFVITATDSSGNVKVETGTFEVEDTTSPAVTGAAAAPNPVELWTPVTLSADVTDAVAVDSVTVEVRSPQGSLVGNYTMVGTGSHYAQSMTPTVTGTYTYTITATDSSGNVKVVTGSFQVHDTTAPTVTAVAASPAPVELGNDVQIAAQATDLGAVASVHVEIHDPSGALVGNYTMSPGTGHWYLYSLTPTELGTYTFVVTATDASGNAKVVTGSFDVQDTLAPAASAGPDRSVTAGTTVTFDGSASADNHAVASYTWTFDDGGAKTLTGVHPTYTFSHTGTYTVTLTVTDPSGNTATDTMTVTVTAALPTTGTISGTVNDASGAPLSGVTVVLRSGTDLVTTTTTDSAGHFSFSSVAPGSYTVVAEAAGYQDASTSVGVIAGQTAQVTLAMTLTPTTTSPPVDWLVVGILVAVVAAAGAGALLYLRARRKA